MKNRTAGNDRFHCAKLSGSVSGHWPREELQVGYITFENVCKHYQTGESLTPITEYNS